MTLHRAPVGMHEHQNDAKDIYGEPQERGSYGGHVCVCEIL
jgi:hypothetical protein